MLVCTLGDLLLDVVVRLAAPLAAGDDTVATTELSPGGQAANVAAWAAVLGARARFVGSRADDETGALLADRLSALGVELAGPFGPGRTGVVVSLVSPGGERTMASDRGVAAALGEIEPGWLAGCDVLHVSGYALAEPAERAAAFAKEAGSTVSLDLSAESLVDAAFRDRVARLAPDLIFASEREAVALGPVAGARLIVKRGSEGVVVDGVEHRAEPAHAIDTTGAGDAFAAGFLVGGVELGLATAARCVAQVGATP